ncbi:hypothetical protein [Kordiimonas aestuarii]|uniref:hypothetical protein n=1 Tax=Kordiimonas aestuarii TaxID=1005925 RepID=UPI0021D0B3AC|nr:hypothetical protein [Kordiimonas aestuarii]
MTDHFAAVGLLPEFRVGDVLTNTFRTFFANFFRFLAFGGVVYGVLLASSAAINALLFAPIAEESMSATRSLSAPPSPLLMLLPLLIMFLMMTVVQSAIVFGAIEYQAGRKASIASMLKVGLRAFVPALCAAILIWVLVSIGMLLLIIPGIIIALMVSVTIPAIVAEGLGPIAALRRSRLLTAGYRWPILGAIVVVIVVATLAQLILSVPAMFLALPIVGGLIALLFTSAMIGVYGSMTASVYTGLRAAKEGVLADDVASVFS